MTTTRDPYTVLGVSKSATAPEIKKDYYKLAKQYHPDSNVSTKATENKLKEVNAAYDFLADATKRARYDRGEIDASGQEKIFTHPGFDRGAAMELVVALGREQGLRARAEPASFLTRTILPRKIF